MDNKPEINVIKIGVIGDLYVGKASVCNSYVSGELKLKDYTNYFNKYETKFKLKNGREIQLILFDSKGQERFHSITLTSIRRYHGIILVFSVIDKNSFENIDMWLNALYEEGIKCFAIFGNKIDMPKDEWKITSEEAKSIAQKNGLAYFETSCKTREGTEEGITYVVNEAYEKLENKNNNNINLNNNKINRDSNCAGKKKNKK